MRRAIYKSKITKIGSFAQETLCDNMLITFKEGAPEDLADYCFIHSHDNLLENLNPGQIFKMGDYEYIITAVGSIANQNLKELGHVTLRFDSNDNAELPGNIHLNGTTPQNLKIDDEIIIFS